MTRIAGVPEELRAAATALAETAPELALAASALSSLSLPEMPPGVAGAVQDVIGEAGSALRRAADVAEREGGDLKRRGLWLELAGDASFAWALALAGKASVDIPSALLDFVERRRAHALLDVWNKYEKAVLPVARDYGDESMQATKMWLLFQRSHPQFATRLLTIAEGAGDFGKYEDAAGVPLAVLRSAGGKILGPVGVVSSFYLLVHPDHTGWERTGDRIAGAAGVLGSGAATLSAFGLVDTAALAIPGVNVAAAALLVGAAGWDLYTHRKEVARALVASGKFLWSHKALVVVGPEGAAAQAIWDHRRELARDAVSVADWGAHRAEDAASLAVSVGSGAVHVGGDAVHEGKKLLGKIGIHL